MKSSAGIFLVATLLCTTCFAADSPMFRGDAQHTGLYDAQGVPAFSKVKWKFKTNGYVISSAAVVAGVAYVGSTDGFLYAIDAESGTQKWKFKTEARIVSSPAVAKGTVFFNSYDGNFYAVDTASGKLKWKFATPGEHRFTARHLHGSLPAGEAMPDPFDVYLSSPVIWNSSVYFGSGDGNIYALSADTGKQVWKFQTGDVVHASPAIADGVLYIGSWDSFFYALDAATGKEKWRFKTGEDADTHNQVGIQSSAAVANGTVFFGCRDSNFYALDAATGSKKWAFNNKGSWVVGSPAVRDGKVYFATSDSTTLHVLAADSGAPVFSMKFHWYLFSSPAIAGNTLYVGSHDGKLYAVDLSSQKIAWEFQTDASKQLLPARSNPDGTINYAPLFTENFYDDMVAGVQKTLQQGSVLSSPVVVDKVVYVGSADGYLYALM
jgi:eukaryotic-like serine/threonine-protein kinase